MSTAQSQITTFLAFQICHTLVNILANKAPTPDTLGLPQSVRQEFCIRLYNPDQTNLVKGWEYLAEAIGKLHM